MHANDDDGTAPPCPSCDALAARNEALRAELRDFSHAISHDLRAPLRHVRGFATALEEDFGEALGDDGRQFLRLMGDGARRMNAMIEGLVRYSRLLTRDIPVEALSLEDVVDDALVEVQRRHGGVRFTRAGALGRCTGSYELLVEVVGQLLDNAARSGGEGAVAVDSDVDDAGRRRVWVRDRGCGIRAADHERIFRVFERVGAARSDDDHTGLGLAMVRRAVERMGGAVGVDSTEGDGARFWIALPMA